MNNEIAQILERFEEYIEDCGTVLMSKTMVKADTQVLFQFTNELRGSIPKEIAAAEIILDDKEGILGDANREATIIVEKAKERAKSLVEEHEISRIANEKANQMLSAANAEAEDRKYKAKMESEEILRLAREEAESILYNANKTAKELTDGGYEYVNDILNQAQLVLDDTLEQSNARYYKFQKYLKNQTDVIARNKEELVDKMSKYNKQKKEKNRDDR